MYLAIGTVSTVIHILVAYAYIRFVNPEILVSNLAGFLVAYLFSYVIQSKVVFRSVISFSKAVKYFLVQFGALFLSIVASNQMFLKNAYLQTLVVAVLLVMISFLTHNLWTFKTKE